MTQVVYRLDGLNCPHCAQAIAQRCQKLPHVLSAETDLATARLLLDCTDSITEAQLTPAVTGIVKQLEPDVGVLLHKGFQNSPNAAQAHDHDHGHSHGAGGSAAKGRFVRAGGAAVLLIVSFLLPERVRPYIHALGWLVAGYDILIAAVRNLFANRALDENLLMSIATIGALALGETAEAVGVMLFYQIGEAFQDMAVAKSRKSITDLMDIRPEDAHLVQEDGTEITVPAKDIQVGDLISVQPFESLPLDGVIEKGSTQMNTAALTGESVPRDATEGDEVLGGFVNGGARVQVRVTRSFENATASRILEMVQDASTRKAPSEQFITRFARVYTPVVVGLAVLLAFIPPLVTGGALGDWVYRALVFLVVSCPCALVLSIPLTFFAGIGSASRQGVLIKGGQYLEALALVDTAVFDKTGTLTHGQFQVTEIHPAEGISEQSLVQAAGLAECHSQHPIALSIASAYPADQAPDTYEEIPGHGTRATANGHTYLAGNVRLMAQAGLQAKQPEKPGAVVHIAMDNTYLGYLLVSDTLKADSRQAIEGLRDIGLSRILLLSGDTPQTVEHIAGQLGITEHASNLLPGDKLEHLEKVLEQSTGKRKVVYIGDGVNDAPVLARADIGVAMGGLGSDAAIEAADVVLMTDQPSKLIDGILISRNTRKIVVQNIVLALAVKIGTLILAALGMASLWYGIFADVGVALLAVLNAMRAMRVPKR